MHAPSHPRTAPAETHDTRSQRAPRAATHHTLTLLLDGITADDYLQWVRDPDPPDREDLKLIAVCSSPLDDCIQLELLVEGEPPPPRLAANAVGFPITTNVAAVRGRLKASCHAAVRLHLACPRPDTRSGGQDSLEKGGTPVGPATNNTQTRLRSLWVLGHRVTPITVGSRVAALEIITPANTPGPPPHHHKDCAEFFYVVAGKLGVMIDDRWTSLGPGGYVEVPQGVTHTFRNEGEHEAQTITGYDPPGFENWFQEFGYDTEQPDAYEASISEETLVRVAEQSVRYGMILTP